MTELDRFRERLRQNRTAQRQTIADTGAATNGQSAPNGAGTLAAGDRVFDVFSGEEGEIVGFTSAHIVVPTTPRGNG